MGAAEVVATVQQVRAGRVRSIAAMAKEAFARHRVTPLWHGLPVGGGLIEARAWHCGAPDSGFHSFTLVTIPGRLVVVGDLGTCVWERERDMLAWARGSLESLDYFASKVVREIETEEYDPDVVRAWAHELDRDILAGDHDYDSRRAKLWVGEQVRQSVLDAIDSGEQEVCRVIYESGLEDGCDFPDFDNWRPGFLWCREAVKWFLANHGG